MVHTSSDGGHKYDTTVCGPVTDILKPLKVSNLELLAALANVLPGCRRDGSNECRILVINSAIYSEI